MKTVVTAIAIFLSVTTPSVRAQEKTSGQTRKVTPKPGEPVTIRLRVSTPKTNVLSVVAFGEPIGQVVSSWNPKDLSIEHAKSRLFLKLLSKTEGHLDVVTRTGKHYRLYLTPVSESGAFDSQVILSRKDTPKNVPATRASRTASGALELVRDMRLGQVSPQTTVRSGKGRVFATTEKIDLNLLYVYETSRFRGYVVGLKNKSKDLAYHVDTTKFQSDRLVLIGARDLVVGPGRSTRLYLVFFSGGAR